METEGGGGKDFIKVQKAIKNLEVRGYLNLFKLYYPKRAYDGNPFV